MLRDVDDPVLQSLHDGVRLAREMSTKAASTVEVVMSNKHETEPARHRKAREASFALFEYAR
jgi:hypothetical protein